MRTFNSGATRDDDGTKLDYEGFLSPIVLEEYARYMNKHRKQADGQLRPSDNWTKGIPKDVYIKSGLRHTMDWWLNHRGFPSREGIKDALCGVIFNVMGYLHELLKKELANTSKKTASEGFIYDELSEEERKILACIKSKLHSPVDLNADYEEGKK